MDKAEWIEYEKEMNDLREENNRLKAQIELAISMIKMESSIQLVSTPSSSFNAILAVLKISE
jgi:hypothetical protein